MDNGNYERWAEVVKTLGHPDRLRIIETLMHHEESVNSICGFLDLPQAKVSQHLALMRSRGIVQDQRCGPYVKYCIKSKWIQEMMELMRGRKFT